MKTINDYAELVKEKHALNKTIAPVETDLTDASRGYHIGEQFIIDGELNKAKTEIAQHDALVLNTNYEPADDLTTQIKNAGGGTGTDPRLDVFENNIAPVETDETDASREYQVGEQLILNNILYDVIAPISEHDVITTTGSGANIAPADPISSQVEALTKGLEDEAATRSKLGAKNRLPITLASLKQIATAGTWANNVYTENGIDFTINTDASDYVTSVVASGTASGVATINLLGTGAEYAANDFAGMILTGCPSGGGNNNYRTVVFIGDNQDGTGHTSQYEDGAGVTIGTNTYLRIYLRVASGTDLTTPITFYPMIRLATDTDTTYQPYAKTNQELTAENQTLTNEVDTIVNDVSAKNILPFDLAYAKKINTTGTWNNNAYSITGVTFTVNDDNTVTVNGTATADTYFRVYYDTDLTGMLVASKKYILSGCPSEVSSGVGALYINGIPNIISIDGSEAEFTYDTSVNRTTISILVHNGATITNKVFEPMIRPASIEDGTYVPYAMTNRELTEKLNVEDLSSQVTLTENCFSCSLVRQANICHINVAAKSGVNGFTSIATIPASLKPKNNTPMAWFAVAGADSSKISDAVLNTNGLISIRTTSATSDIAYLSCTWIV